MNKFKVLAASTTSSLVGEIQLRAISCAVRWRCHIGTYYVLRGRLPSKDVIVVGQYSQLGGRRRF